MLRTSLLLVLILGLAAPAFTQLRPELFFREDWKETPAEIPVKQAHVANPDLELGVHGPGAGVVKKSHHDKPADDPYYIWSGLAEGNWAVSLRHRASMVDMTGQAKIRWRSKQAGFRELRIILKLADGNWIVSDQSDPPAVDWRIREFNIAALRWRKLDIEQVVESDWVENPDLSRVDAIGFTDLMRGGASRACSRLDWIEVDGRAVKREK